MSVRDETARIRAALRARGFTGSVRMDRGTAYGWVVISGTASDFGTFTEAENEILRDAFGTDAGRSNVFLIAPDHERDARLTRSYALQLLERTRCPDCGTPWDIDETPRCEGCGLSWQDVLDAAAFVDAGGMDGLRRELEGRK
jgi:hypothetical protein